MRYESFNTIEFSFSQHKNFFLFLVIFSNFLTIPVVSEKSNVRPAHAIRTGAPTTLVIDITDTPLLVELKTIKILSI